MQRTTMSDGLAVLHIGWLHVIIEEENTWQSKRKVLIRLREWRQLPCNLITCSAPVVSFITGRPINETCQYELSRYDKGRSGH